MKLYCILALTIFLTSCAGNPDRDVIYMGKIFFKKEAYEEGLIKEIHSELSHNEEAVLEDFQICFFLHKDNKLECVDIKPEYLKAEKVDYDRENNHVFSLTAKPQDISLKAAKVIGPQTFKYNFKKTDDKKIPTPARADFVYIGDFLISLSNKNKDEAPGISFFSSCKPEFLEDMLIQNEDKTKTMKPYTSCFEIGRVIQTKHGPLTLMPAMSLDD